MGYTTEFEGKIAIEPPLDLPLWHQLNDYADGDSHAEEGTCPGGYCQWVPTKDGTGLQWDGNEKFYNSPEWMKHLIEAFIAPTGRICNGTLFAQGEERGDVWHLIVENNKVFTKKINRQVVEQVIESQGDRRAV
jgi:hypothetical protein